MHIGYWWERQKGRDRYEQQDRWVDNIRMDLRETGLDWIALTQGEDQWRAPVKTLGFQQMLGCFSVAAKLAAINKCSTPWT
jgi:hypothetical protein